MAEINIQRRERTLWPWVLGAIAIVLLIMLISGVFGNRDMRNNGGRSTDTTTQSLDPETPREL